MHLLRRAGIRLAALSVALAAGVSGLPAGQETRQVSVEGLTYDLQHPNAERRKAAARTLGDNKVRSAVPALIDATGDRNEGVRYEAVRALVNINDTRALRAYVKLTSDSKRKIQHKAIEGLIEVYVSGQEGFMAGVTGAVNAINPLADDFDSRVVESYVPVSADAVHALERLLEDDDAGIRAKAALALGILRARSALPSIQEALRRESKRDVQVELIRALYKIGDRPAGTALIPLLESGHKKVRDEAIFALGRLRVREAAPELEGFLDVQERRKVFRVVPVSGKDDLQKRALEALAHIGDPSTKGLFINSLQDPRAEFRRYGAEGLGRIGEGDILNDLARAHLREDSGEAKLAMSFALYRLGREEHLIELVESLKSREQGYQYLLEMDSAEVSKLYPYLESESGAKVRRRLLDVIGLRGNRSALPAVRKVAESAGNNSELLSAANRAIRRLQSRSGG